MTCIRLGNVDHMLTLLVCRFCVNEFGGKLLEGSDLLLLFVH